MPSNLLQSQSGARVTVETMRFRSADWHAAARPDVVVFQRYHDPEHVQLMQEIVKAAPDTFYVYEIDDLLTEIPTANFHSSFVSPEIEAGMKIAIGLCDRVVVTTPELARWAKDEMGAKEVLVVPNYIPESYVRERQYTEHAAKKPIRVGWAGGHSHTGDLALLQHAIENVRDVQWVFFGMHPDMDLPESAEFHPFVPINAYMDKLHSLDIDLFLAPLEAARFNKCKSDLKLLEAGAIGAAVIATPTEPYMQFDAPLFAYPWAPEEWTEAINQFKALSVSRRRHHAKQMQTWVKTKRTYEANLETRNAAWLPDGVKPWMPSQESRGARPLYVVSEGKQREGKAYTDLEQACADAIEANADVLWLRKGATLSPEGLKRLRVALLEDRLTASIAPLANDGSNSFPRLNQMTPMSAEQGAAIDAIARTAGAGKVGYMAAFSGPCLLIRNQALRMFGAPDVAAYDGDAELALVDWTARATESGLRNIQLFDVFASSTESQLSLSEVKLKRLEARDVIRFLKSPATPMPDGLREEIELRCLAADFGGITNGTGGLPNDYRTWAALKTYPAPISDGSKVVRRAYGDMSDVPDGSYTLFCTEGTLLHPNAAVYIQDALDAGADFVFGDHEETDDQGNIAPHFKVLDRTLLDSSDYITPICGVRKIFPGMTAGDLYYLARDGSQKVVHIPHVLARVKRKTAEQGASESKRIKAIHDFSGEPNVTEINPHIPESGFVFYRPIPKHQKSVAVIIKFSGSSEKLAPCISTLLKITDYPISRVVVASNDTLPIIDTISAIDGRIEFEHTDAKSTSRILNSAAAQCLEDIIVFMSDEIRTVLPHWLGSMVARLEDDTVGAVGARICHRAGIVAHAGVVVQNGVPSFSHRGMAAHTTGYFGLAALSHEASAASLACLAVRRGEFKSQRFYTEFDRDFMDIDLCIRLQGHGLKTVIECSAQMETVEPMNRTPDANDFERFVARHKGFVDPYLSPSLAVTGAAFDYGTLAVHKRTWTPSSQRVLLINDATELQILSSAMEQESKAGNIVFRAVLDGFNLIMVAPAIENLPSIDMRDPMALKRALELLQINRVVMPSISGSGAPPAVTESVRALMHTGIQFHYTGPVNAMICPRLTMTVNGESCGDGWKNGPAYCQKCIADNGSPFGLVDAASWLATWNDYVGAKAQEAGVA